LTGLPNAHGAPAALSAWPSIPRVERLSLASLSTHRGRDELVPWALGRRGVTDMSDAGAMESWSWPPRYDDRYMPPQGQPYWFPHRETMASGVREAAILARIREVMAYAYERSPFYRRKWDEAGIHPAHIRSLEDFERVPPVTKLEIRAAQEASPPFGDYLCIPEGQVSRIHGSSGTTGRPTAFGIGQDDWSAIANSHARIMWGMGIRPADMVFIGSFFSLYLGSWGALVGAERLHARVFPFGAGISGQTLRAANWMLQMRPTVFYGTPSYALHLAETARANSIDPQQFGLRILFFSGEPGASVPSIRRRLEQDYGAAIFDSGSMAEMTPWMTPAETSGHAGMLCWQDIVYTEVVHPRTNARVPYGREGTLVYTHLERLSQPMIRMLSNDLSRWEAGPSPCGRTYPLLPRGIYGRIDDMFIVRGENMFPSAIDEVMNRLPHYAGEHRIVITRDQAMDELMVHMEYDQELQSMGDGSVAGVRLKAEEELRTVLGVSARVRMVPPGTLERTEFKARRVIDRRDLIGARQ
jgi:phenylacetate-CoA ligase